MRFSMIVPVLNEEAVLEDQLIHRTRQCTHHACEVPIVDGGSHDGTGEIARRYGKVMAAPRGRATQMNAGAAAASGDVLLFLHADTLARWYIPGDGDRSRITRGRRRGISSLFHLRALALPAGGSHDESAFAGADRFYARREFQGRWRVSRSILDGRSGDHETAVDTWQGGSAATIWDDIGTAT